MFNVNIIGIDPGSNYLGIGIIEFNLYDHQVTNILAYTVDVNQLTPASSTKHKDDKYKDLANYIYSLWSNYQPVAIGLETPYIQEGRPLAARPLYILNYLLLNSVRLMLGNTPILYLAPKQLKSIIGAKELVGKEPVKDAILRIEEITNHLSSYEINNLDNNAIDGLAAAYATLAEYRRSYPCHHNLKTIKE